MTALISTGLGSLRIAQTEGEGDEMTRAGLRVHMSATGATGIGPVQAIPSVAAQWLIYNPIGNTTTAFLDVLGMVNLSGTAGSGEVVLAAICPPSFAPATVPTISAANVKLMNANPVSQKSSNLIVVSAQTLQNAAAGNWAPIAFGVSKDGVVAVPPVGMGVAEQRDIRGKYCIPPGCSIALAVIAPAGTTPLYAPYASWREYVADIE
jgi:hypothetical protein